MKKLILLLFTAVSFSAAKSQDINSVQNDQISNPRNLIKLNLSSALIRNYSLQYERIFTKRFSMSVNFRLMPEGGVPFADKIIERSDITDADAQNLIRKINIGDYAFTPEIRLYTGRKGYGQGFYFSFFYRYGHYTFNNALIPYTNDLDQDLTLTTSGKISTNTGGFMIGSQWSLGKHMCLDWWILGPQFGVSSGSITSLSSGTLSETDQQDIENEVNDIDVPMFKHTLDINANRISLKFDGPWAGFRAGLSLGVRF